MVIIGNDPGPYHEKGLRVGLERIRQAAAAGEITARELGDQHLAQWFGHRRAQAELEIERLKTREA